MVAAPLLLFFASAPFGSSVLDAELVPVDGAVVPTNAHLFVPIPLPLFVTLTTPAGSSSLVLDLIPQDGVPLGDLPPDSDVAVTIDDGVDARALHFHTGDGPDNTAPIMSGSVDPLVVTSSERDPEVILHVDPGSDDVGVAVYAAVDDHGRRFEAEAVSDGPTDVGGFVDTSKGAVDLKLTVVAVDFAGNESAPAGPFTVHLPKTSSGGCATTDAPSSAPLVVAAALLWSRRRGTSADRSRSHDRASRTR